MKVSLQLYANEIYRKQPNNVTEHPVRSNYYLKKALNGECYFCHMGFQGDIYIALACPLF